MLIADCGTTYTKILDTETDDLTIISTKDLLRDSNDHFDAATGHLGRVRTEYYKNELICLARGARELIGLDSFCIVDVGGRDTKLVRYLDGKPVRLDWNAACGANTGFTLEIVGRYFDIDFNTLDPSDDYVDVTCGVFGIEKVFDAIIDGVPQNEAISRFVHGIARNVYRLADRNDKFYFSGGLTLNKCFMKTIARYAEVVPMGRTVLLTGLLNSYNSR